MSIHSYPIMFVGQTFEIEEEALDFLREKGIVNEEQFDLFLERIRSEEWLLEECIDELKIKGFPNTEHLNCATGEGYFIGYTLAAYKAASEPEEFAEDLKVAKEKWEQLFGEAGELFHEVQVR